MSRKDALTKTFGITLKEVKLAKVGRRRRALPCTKEMEDYIASLGDGEDEESEYTRRYGRLLALCMEQWNPNANKSSIAFHLSQFVKR